MAGRAPTGFLFPPGLTVQQLRTGLSSLDVSSAAAILSKLDIQRTVDSSLHAPLALGLFR